MKWFINNPKFKFLSEINHDILSTKHFIKNNQIVIGEESLSRWFIINFKKTNEMSDVFDTCENNFLKNIRFVQKTLQ